MVKTQVQTPDELYRKAKQIAKEREWSLAEVIRRGLEYITRACPPTSGVHTSLPLLPANLFIDTSDGIDLKAISVENETMRSIE